LEEIYMQKKALIFWGGWEGHTPKASAETVAAILSGHGVDVVVGEGAKTLR
jgi:type 1 glutamine amidotransferase